MNIRELKGQDIESYKGIAAKYGTVFDSAELFSIYGDNVKIYGFYDDNGEVVGGFHLFRDRKFGLSIYRNAPFSPCVGPFLKESGTSREKLYDTWKKALASMAEFLENLPYAIISISLNKSVIDTQPFLWKKYKVCPSYTYMLDLSESVDALWSRLSANHRNRIRKANKDGLETRLKRSGIWFSRHSPDNPSSWIFFLDKLLSFYGPENSYGIATYLEDTCLSASFFVHDSFTCYALLGGYDQVHKHVGAGALDRWEGIKHAKDLKLKYFDFEGSMLPRIERFYREFGGELTPYYTVSKARLPIEIALKFYKRQQF